jgi:hypothetical protein
LYRTSGAVIEEIVLQRRSRTRVRPLWAFVFTAVVVSIAAMVEVAARDHWVATPVAIAVIAPFAIMVLLVRTQKLMVVRAGRELRIREGRRRESVLVGEILDVEIDTRGVHVHDVVFVLRDGRRVPVGAPRALMDHAASDRRTIRNALLR